MQFSALRWTVFEVGPKIDLQGIQFTYSNPHHQEDVLLEMFEKKYEQAEKKLQGKTFGA